MVMKIVKEEKEAREPDDELIFEDWICCPLNPSTLKASTIFGTFLNIVMIQSEYKISNTIAQGNSINKILDHESMLR